MLFDDDAGVARGLDDEDAGAQRDGLVRLGVQLDRLPADGDADLAVALGRDRGHHHAEAPTRSARVGVASVRIVRRPGRARRCRWRTGTATTTPAITPTTTEIAPPPVSDAGDRAAEPERADEAGDRRHRERAVDVGVAEVQHVAEEERRGEQGDADASDEEERHVAAFMQRPPGQRRMEHRG